ncbi:hypothetical protein IF1G_06056 [Cordyceps javanica]|uniref:Uncharacterized protein n=1 Tax=Cordyceps javanica TaxID=43265 RepID=A0A545V061_9HYPO|nr:hypothetical protein IF1G_06056 [Cordyceps javanica]
MSVCTLHCRTSGVPERWYALQCIHEIHPRAAPHTFGSAARCTPSHPPARCLLAGCTRTVDPTQVGGKRIYQSVGIVIMARCTRGLVNRSVRHLRLVRCIVCAHSPSPEAGAAPPLGI